MLNEFLEIFLGAYAAYVPEDYIHYIFFQSCLSVGVLLLLLACVCVCVCILTKGIINIVVRNFKE